MPGTSVRNDFAMKELITVITRNLVDEPNKVDVSVAEGKMTTVYGLKVAPEDLGKVIGRQGRTAQAIRTILSAASGREKKKTVLEIIE